MKLSNKLSSGLFLALSIALPSVFVATAAKAEPTVKAPSALNQTVTPIKVTPGLAGKVDTIRPNGKNPGDAAWEFSLVVKGKDEAVKANPAVKPSAVGTFNSINKTR